MSNIQDTAKNKKGQLYNVYSYYDRKTNTSYSNSNYICVYESGNYSGNHYQIDLPNYPDEISDSGSANYSEESLLGRSSPLVSYTNTGFREVSFSFDVHREELDSNGIDKLLKIIRASVYPTYNGAAALRPTITTVRLGDFYVKGITKSYSFTWKKPIIDNKYQVCTISMTISHVIDKAYSMSDIVGSSNSPANPF